MNQGTDPKIAGHPPSRENGILVGDSYGEVNYPEINASVKGRIRGVLNSDKSIDFQFETDNADSYMRFGATELEFKGQDHIDSEVFSSVWVDEGKDLPPLPEDPSTTMHLVMERVHE